MLFLEKKKKKPVVFSQLYKYYIEYFVPQGH